MSRIWIAASALLLAGCMQPGRPIVPANVFAEPAALALQQRAASMIGSGQAAEFAEVLPPFRVAADSLGGTQPLPWRTAVYRSLVTTVYPSEAPPRATMEFEKSNGSIMLIISQSTGWQFYVECDVRPVGNVPQLSYNWTYWSDPGPQVRDRATYHPSTNRWAFVTPPATAPMDKATMFTFWAQESGAPADAHWMLHECAVLPFKLAR